jgi:integrase
MKLTQPAVGQLKLPPGKTDHIEFDDDLPGFGVRLRAGGKRTWIIQYRFGRKQRRFTLAAVDKLPAKEARKEADQRLARVTLGGDPQAKKIDDRAKAHVTFAAVLEDYSAAREREVEKGELRQGTHGAVELYLRKHCRPLHEMQLDKISRADIATRLGAVRKTSGETSAIRARSALSGFFAWAVGEGRIDVNPVIGTNKLTEPAARKRVLSDAEVAEVWAACREDDFGRIVKLLMLTAARRDEIASLAAGEVDLDRAEINLPAERTKNGEPHMIPLSALALSIVEAVPRRAGRERLFGDGEGGFSGWSKAKMALDQRILEARELVAGKGEKAKPMAAWRLHDLRRTAATLMPDRLGVLPHIVEAVLNHISGHKAGVAGTYNWALYAAEKRAALALWGEHVRAIVEGGERKVVPLRRAIRPC